MAVKKSTETDAKGEVKKAPVSKKTAVKKTAKVESVKETPAKAMEENSPAKPVKQSKAAKAKIESPAKKNEESTPEIKPAKPEASAPVVIAADLTGPKTKVKTILISQPKPETEKSPYVDLARKFNLKVDFRQFIQIEPVPSKDFRSQKVNINEHNAVILTSRIAIDHYFRMCNEMRYTVPETTKYFCLTESIAYYLQKYVQYRKRKIFFGNQSIKDLVEVIKKHKDEKFLLPVSDVHREQIVDFLDDLKLSYSKAIFYKTVAADLSDLKGKLDYDLIVFFTPAGVRSLFKNFPDFKQGDKRIGVFGATAFKEAKELGLRVDIAAPVPNASSMATALDNYIREVNKR